MNMQHGLDILPEDPRDFPLGSVFGDARIESVPDTDFVVADPLAMKDQGQTDLCSAYAVTEASEDQEGIELLPEYQFYLTKKISGNPDAWGADLRSACKSATVGSLPVKGYERFRALPREEILKASTWPYGTALVAALYRKETFFKVDTPYDTFDSIRAALWKHRADKSTVVTGALWRNEWLGAPGGVIPEKYGDSGFGHAFKFFGQKVIDGKLYLVAQLSQGVGVGDVGIFYFSRAVTNREIGKYGMFMFKDLSRKDAEHYMKVPYTKGMPFYKIVWAVLMAAFKPHA